MVFVMRKWFAFLRLSAPVSLATLLVASAQANPAISAAPAYPGYYQQQSPLGGGLIEALVGEDSGPVRYAAPPAARPHPGARVAAYAPPQPEEMQRSIDPMYMRTEVDYQGSEGLGTIVVDTPNKFLYFVHGHGHATRYGIGVGRPGFEWSGVKSISRKAEWPDWTPPAEMLARRPDLPRHMEGGPANPLGARALYLGSSLYRIHGTNEPHTIGQNVSSGCIRMMNDDVVDLYNRAPVGTRVVVR
jgi:lipoprotein-anchoring transpeptidase ErfK/SrfK